MYQSLSNFLYIFQQEPAKLLPNSAPHFLLDCCKLLKKFSNSRGGGGGQLWLSAPLPLSAVPLPGALYIWSIYLSYFLFYFCTYFPFTVINQKIERKSSSNPKNVNKNVNFQLKQNQNMFRKAKENKYNTA
jgi:hypothetical protein